MKKKHLISKIAAISLAVTLISGCTNGTGTSTNIASESTVNEATTNESTVTGETTSTINDEGEIVTSGSIVTSDMVEYDEEDSYTDWQNENPITITLNGDTATSEGTGVTVDGSDITITAAGVYVISGELNDGQIIVDTQDEEIVRLVLNGVVINCSDSSPIYVMNADKVVLSLVEGTQNKVTDGSSYVLADAEADEPNAAIFSKADFVINGTGILTVEANYNNGITSKDDLIITGGTININAVDDGLLGKDCVIIKEAEITINAGGDGIKATNDTETDKGYIAIESGNFDITTGADGIQAQTSVLISDGEFEITTGGGSKNAPAKVSQNGPGGGKGNQQVATTTQSDDETSSAKGIKALSNITINGGTFSIDSYDDAIHSNDGLNIAGGDIMLAAGDDGLHADTSLGISNGTLTVTKSYEGIESAIISISGGNIKITSSDDGINVAGGNDQSAMDDSASFNSTGNNMLSISGGYVYMNAAGDGLDSNGSIEITGGTILVSGPTDDGNAPTDYNGTFVMDGGMLIAAGSSGMVQATSDTSSEYSVLMVYSNMQEAGTLVHLEDADGNTVMTFAPEKAFESILICSPELAAGTYTLYTGGTADGTQTNGLYTDGTYDGGTKTVEFEITGNVTWLSESGVTEPQVGHGQGGGGGMGKTGRPGMNK